jgi:hypothetical protein
VPNDLLDGAMPGLRDTELRVLLVVVRQTRGWQEGPDPKQRKERDWLTQSQLMRRTGRASGAVSRAVDALVRGGLIDVLDRAGAPLMTPMERRRHLGRLYYRLRRRPDAGRGIGQHKTEHAKPHTTKVSKYKNIGIKNQTVDKAVENPVSSLVRIRTRGWERVTYPGEHVSERTDALFHRGEPVHHGLEGKTRPDGDGIQVQDL